METDVPLEYSIDGPGDIEIASQPIPGDTFVHSLSIEGGAVLLAVSTPIVEPGWYAVVALIHNPYNEPVSGELKIGLRRLF